MEAPMPELLNQSKLQNPPPKSQSQENQNKPHWAIELLQNPAIPLPSLEPGVDYPNCANQQEALGLFDPKAPGRVPTWFPREVFKNRWTAQEQMEPLTPQQRLDWFDQALEHYAPEELQKSERSSSMKQNVALSLLHMF